MEYIFTLKYQLADHDSDLDLLVERLGAAGCDDALAGVGQPGRLALEFSREAESAEEAVRTALADVVGISRQAMRKLMLAHRATFPMPVHEGSASIWRLAEVLDWLSAASPRTIARAAAATGDDGGLALQLPAAHRFSACIWGAA